MAGRSWVQDWQQVEGVLGCVPQGSPHSHGVQAVGSGSGLAQCTGGRMWVLMQHCGMEQV